MNRNKSFKKWWSLWFVGMFMGIADLIPGISGGTVAFLSGIYQQLLNGIKSINFTAVKLLLKGQFKLFAEYTSFKFLSAIIAGIAFSLVVFSHLLKYVLNHPFWHTCLFAVFMGLVVASTLLCLKKIPRFRMTEAISLLMGILAAATLLSMDTAPKKEPLYDVYLGVFGAVNQLELADNWRADTQMLTSVPSSTLSLMLSKGIVSAYIPAYSHDTERVGYVQDFVQSAIPTRFNTRLFFCGALAVSAMLLPGISGSYLMQILAVYPLIISAITDFSSGLLHGNFHSDAFWTLFSMGMGIIAGLILFSRLLIYLFDRFTSSMTALLCGIMLGALKTIWPFWSYTYRLNPLHPLEGNQLHFMKPIWPTMLSEGCLALILAMGGFAFVMLIDILVKRKKVVV